MATDHLHEPGRLGVEYRLLEPPPPARVGLGLPLRVAIRNTGAAVWPNTEPHPVNLSYHWRDAQGAMVDFNGVRALLPAPLQPGEAAELELWAEPPERAGDYLLELDMVEENRGWFSLQGVASLTVPITVEFRSMGAPYVCIVNTNCFVNDAVGNHVANQIGYFLERGYEVLALLEYVDQRRPAELRRYMVEISRDALRTGTLTTLTRRAIHFFRNADIYIFHYPIFYPLFEAITWVERGVVIMDYHCITPPHLWEGVGIEGLIEGQRKLGLARYADYAIAHSEYAREELLASGAISPERTYVMPYIVPLEGFRRGARDAELVARYGLEGRPVLLYVGRMAGNKRIIDLVRALPLIRQRHPDTVLLLVGDNTTLPYMGVVAEARAEAVRLGCADQVIFTGPVDHSQLHRYYNTCDVYVTSSLHEGFCVPVIEAMACGRPAVGTDITALPETIGPAGLTFQPRDPADLAAKVLQILDSRPPTTPGLSQDGGDDRSSADQGRRSPTRVVGTTQVME
jgi:glycosyltransferase involved in cell wall biosynthesis